MNAFCNNLCLDNFLEVKQIIDINLTVEQMTKMI